MRWRTLCGLALALGLTGSALAQDSKDENTLDEVDIDALLADEEPKGSEPATDDETAPEAEATKAEPTPSDAQKADQESLGLVSYPARALFESNYYGATLVRAERHLGHIDVYFITQDGKKMMAEVRPDNSFGKVEKASF